MSSKIEPFANPRGKIDVKQKTVHNAKPTLDLCTSISKLQASVDSIMKNQEEMMNRIVRLELNCLIVIGLGILNKKQINS